MPQYLRRNDHEIQSYHSELESTGCQHMLQIAILAGCKRTAIFIGPTNQYPLNITDAKDALHTHYWDKLPNKKNKDKNKNSDKKDKNASNTSFYERSEAKSFKIKNRRKELIYDSDWIAGVDYEDQKDQNIADDDDYSDYEPSVAPYADAQELNNECYFHEEDEYYYKDYDTDDFIAEERANLSLSQK